MTERQKCLWLLSIIIEDLSTSAIDALIKTDYNASTAMFNNVRISRPHNLKHLATLMRVGLSNY